METQPLTPQQRDVLIQQVTRRMTRLPDEALLQFEALTRHPQISRYTGEDEPNTRLSPRPTLPLARERPAEVTDRPMNRREALQMGASGFMGLLAVSAGGGWLVNNNRLGEIETMIVKSGDAQFYVALRGTLARMTGQLNLLHERCDTSCAQKDALNAQVMDYQGRVMPTFQSVAAVRSLIEQIRLLEGTLNEGNLLGEFFAVMAKKNLLLIGDFLLRVGEKAAALWEYFQKIPELLAACEHALGQLNGWFSEQENIDVRLLRPLQDTLFHAVDDARTQAGDLQQAWQLEVNQVLPPTLDRWQQIRSKAEG